MTMQTLKGTVPYGGSGEINGNYDHSKTNYAEKVKEKQVAEGTEKAKEKKSLGKLSVPQDEYISGEKSGKESAGLYRLDQDKNGNRKILIDALEAVRADGKEEAKADGNNSEKPAEKCVTNTDKVDREIKKLKEKKQQLKQQIQSASRDEKKIRDLEKKLTQVENELSQKDNAAYRRQNASFISSI